MIFYYDFLTFKDNNDATKIKIAGNHNNTVVKLTTLIVMLNTTKQIKLITDEANIITPPVLARFKQKKEPTNENTKQARFKNGIVLHIIFVAPPATAPIKTNTSQNTKAQTAPIMLETKPI